jgi:hypothetical protein
MKNRWRNLGDWDGYVRYVVTLCLAFLLVLLIPFFGRFICPLTVAGLGFKYLVTRSSERLGHLFKNPFCKAFNREDILGLHIAWCPKFTVLAHVRTECVNMATDAASVNGFGDCGARAIPGPVRGWSFSPWEVHSFL